MKRFSTKKLVLAGMLAAVAGVLMSFEFPLPFMPPFYKVDFSDVPSVIALFSLGPGYAASVEIIKVIVKMIIKGTTTFGVGELANFISVIFFVLPIWLIYSKGGKTIKAVQRSLIWSIPVRIAFSCCVNAFITLPLYAKAMGVDINAVVQMVSAANPLIKNLPLFIVLATVPFNLIKNSLNNFIGYLLFTRLERAKVIKAE